MPPDASSYGNPLAHLNSLSLDRHDVKEPARPGSRDSNCSDTSMSSESNFNSSSPAYLQSQRPELYDYRIRNRSPYSRGYLRPQAVAASSPAAPPMARTQSSPAAPVGRSFSPSPTTSPLRQASPSNSPKIRPRASPRSSFEHSPSSSFMDIVSIAEDAELDITPRLSNTTPVTQNRELLNSSIPPPAYSSAFTRSNSFGRRRPASPLAQQVYQPPPTPSTNNISPFPSGPNSPLTPPLLHSSSSTSSLTRTASSSTTYNETYPGFLTASTPSTPTSFRSRSPSVSSLETIPDTPDGEEAAMEAHEIARLKAAAEAEEELEKEEEEEAARGMGGGRRRASGDGLGGGIRSGWWVEKGRKRWSVCGAERRGDFEMETIWED